MVTKETSKKTESESQCDYELVFIISPEIDDDAHNTVIENISQLITAKDGVVSEVEQWGKKRLAYPIKHFGDGSYVLIRLKLNPLSNKELETNLQLSEMILRYLLIKIE